MTDTAATIIGDALTDLVVQASEQDLTASETTTAIRYMNRYMAQLSARGVNLGYTVVSNLGDDITIPDGALDGLRARLAIRLAPMFDVPVPVELQQAANDAEKAMYALGVQLREMQYPDRLPVGSGNENFENGDSAHFFPNRQNELRTEDNQSILAENNTPSELP